MEIPNLVCIGHIPQIFSLQSHQESEFGHL